MPRPFHPHRRPKRLQTLPRNSARRIALALAFVSPAPILAQGNVPAAVRPVQGAFVGFIHSTLDSTVVVKSVDVRLYFIDSTQIVRDSSGANAIEAFVDTLRSRLAVSDSVGYFTFWRLAPGKYLMQARRIGFRAAEAFVTVDSETIMLDFRMDPIAALLNKVDIVDVATVGVAKRLERVGFNWRRKSNGEGGTFITPADIQKRKAITLADMLSAYGLHDRADYRLDRMPLEYSDIQDYPAELVAGIEIYRHIGRCSSAGRAAAPR